MSSDIKQCSMVGKIAVHLSRLYIRYSPVSSMKWYLWTRLRDRNFNYKAKTRFGAVMVGNAIDTVQGRIYYFGIWEPNLTKFISRRLNKEQNRTFVDVGANVGYFSLLAATKMSGGAIIAVEAFPDTYKKLEANIQLNGINNIRTLPLAATDKNCDLKIYYSGIENEGATTTVPDRFDTDPIVVQGKPLSDLLTVSEVETIKLLKIDVEGAEYSVVQGMVSILDKLPLDAEIIIEISRGEGDKSQEIFSLFENAGYFAYSLENPYSPAYYMSRHYPSKPARINSIPLIQTDVIFSRVDAEYL